MKLKWSHNFKYFLQIFVPRVRHEMCIHLHGWLYCSSKLWHSQWTLRCLAGSVSTAWSDWSVQVALEKASATTEGYSICLIYSSKTHFTLSSMKLALSWGWAPVHYMCKFIHWGESHSQRYGCQGGRCPLFRRGPHRPLFDVRILQNTAITPG
jgi:hypothetical protein